MTWKRVATAAVLIPFAVGLVLWGSTALLALAVALVTLLALFEYFALGEAIGHRAYRFWTATCALVLIYSQWQGNAEHGYVLGLVALERRLRGGPPSLDAAFFLFVLGIAILTLFTKRPMVEGLPSAGISASGLILIAFPLSFAIPLHAAGPQGPALLLFAMVIIWVGDTAAYFVGRSIGRYKLAPHLSPKKTWEGTVCRCRICWGWRRWGTWRGRWATSWNRRINGARGSRIRGVSCRDMAACLTESTRSSSPFRLSGIIGY